MSESLRRPRTQDGRVASPCISNCCLDEEDICLGCFRHIDEITGWHTADDQRREQILVQCETRHSAQKKWLESVNKPN